MSEFDETAVAIIKHTNPCGASTGATVVEAYRRALEADPVSAFGGVIGVNREVDAAAAEEIAKLFVEAIVAPSFSAEALERFSAKKNLRLVKIVPAETPRVLKQVSGGLLVQDADRLKIAEADLKVVTERKPTAEEMRAADENRCISYGFRPRTDAFAECLQRIDIDRRMSLREASRDALFMPPVVVVREHRHHHRH